MGKWARRAAIAAIAAIASAVAMVLVARTTARPISAAPPRAAATVAAASRSVHSDERAWPPGWVAAENARPGTDAWRLVRTRTPADIEGYADRTSAAAGNDVGLYVSTTATSFTVEAYRMGSYHGAGGRLVWRSSPTKGVVQPPATRDVTTNMVEAKWARSLTLHVGDDWPPGDYLLKLVSSAGGQRYIPLAVRDPVAKATLVVLNAVTTWQAYNLWGGYDLYQGPARLADLRHRSRIVSFDRPYAGDGDGGFLGTEYPLVAFAESLGLDLSYATDVDLHTRRDLLDGQRALLTLGHDEYWSTPMRQAAERARDAGVNIAFFGANAVFRHIRFASSPVGPDRRVVAYKSASEDPVRKEDPSEVTVDWREPPVSQPERSLVGQQYECNPVHADLVITAADSWPFAGTGVREGDHLTGVVGPEYDRFQPGREVPAAVDVLAHSPVRCGGRPSFSDVTYYSAPSGAGVFATGTNWWIPKLPVCSAPPCDDAAVLSAITGNVLRAFATGPAGRAHASTGLRPPRWSRASPTTTTLVRARARTTVPRRRTTITPPTPASTAPAPPPPEVVTITPPTDPPPSG